MQEQSSANPKAAHHPTPPGHPHACTDGFVYLGYVAEDPDTGEEVEHTEQIPCRRCAEEREDYVEAQPLLIADDERRGI